MKSRIPFQDSLYRLAQIGTATGMQLVRVTGLSSGNRYTARAVEFAAGGATDYAEDETIQVTNLAEPADVPGGVPAGTDAVALDVEGRWVVFLRQAGGAGSFPVKVVAALGSASYSVREQTMDSAGAFHDKSGATLLTARNLAELSLGPGAAVSAGTIVLVAAAGTGGSQYCFDHPVYAKYLD